MCRQLGVPAITRRYLEAVTKFYPDNEELQVMLADEYSKNYHTGKLALKIANSTMGISEEDGKFVLADNAKVTERKLASFFNVYLHQKKYDDLITIGQMLEERFSGKDKVISLITRNMASAFIHMDNLEMAKHYLDKLIITAPENDLTHYHLARYYNTLGDYAESIRRIENCIRLDPSDEDYYFAMSAYICDDHFARNPETMQVEKIEPSDAARLTMPFLVAAVENDPRTIERAINYLRRNRFMDFIQPLLDAFQSGSGIREHFPNLDFRAVDFCMTKSITSDE